MKLVERHEIDPRPIEADTKPVKSDQESCRDDEPAMIEQKLGLRTDDRAMHGPDI